MQATYVYDALGRRIEKDATQSGATTITRFAYDGSEIWSDLNSSNALVTRYMRGDRVLEFLARIASGGAAAWVLADRMGSVRNVMDATGTALDTITYDGYGNVTSETAPTNGGVYKYAGYRLDGEIGWYRPDPTTARFNDPVAGRWLGRDPWDFRAADSNLYRYVHNNPLNRVDPSGHQATATAPPEPCDDDEKPCAEQKKEAKCQGLEPTEMPDPKKDKTLSGLTYCSNGELKPKYYDPRPGDPYRGDKCFKDCVKQHEEYHMKQVAAWCPWFCKCNSKGDVDIGYTKLDSNRTAKIWECPAHIVTYLCLKAALDDADKNGCSREALAGAIKDQETLLMMFCGITSLDPLPPKPPDPPVYPK
jgi:RHS repeat-associated protein